MLCGGMEFTEMAHRQVQEKFNRGGAHIGAMNELVACTWLMARGYHVFRNVSPRGPVDLIGMTEVGKIVTFDVKTATPDEARKKKASYRLSRKQELLGVQMIIVYPDGICAIIPAKSMKVRKHVLGLLHDKPLPRGELEDI